MKFGLLVSEGPYTHQASDTAYQFAMAGFEEWHLLNLTVAPRWQRRGSPVEFHG